MSTAAEIRDAKKPKTVDVTVPGTTLVITCRRPDLLKLVAQGWVSWPALAEIQKLATERAQADDRVMIDNRPVPTALSSAKSVAAFIDEYVCAAALSPRVVLTEAERDGDVLWIDELELDLKLAILAATREQTPAEVADFRGDQPNGAADRSGGETVRESAV